MSAVISSFRRVRSAMRGQPGVWGAMACGCIEILIMQREWCARAADWREDRAASRQYREDIKLLRHAKIEVGFAALES